MLWFYGSLAVAAVSIKLTWAKDKGIDAETMSSFMSVCLRLSNTEKGGYDKSYIIKNNSLLGETE